jgi:hypothetical protein
MATGVLAHLRSQGSMETVPLPTVTPLAEIPVPAVPIGILMRQHPPLNAAIYDIKDGIDYGPHVQGAVASARFWWRYQIFDKMPFGISEVCWVWIGVHPSSFLN